MLSRIQRVSVYRNQASRFFHASACHLAAAAAAVTAAETNKRRLDVAIVGAPNAGKSQLLNVLTGSTVAAVSRKRHTTREGILGARTVVGDDGVATQLLFVDTPGFLRSTREQKLDRDLMVSAKADMDYVDYTVIVIDGAARLTDDVRESLMELMMQAYKSKGRIDDGAHVSIDFVDPDDTELTNPDKKPVTQVNPPTVAEETKSHDSKKFAVVLNKSDLVSPKQLLMDKAIEIGYLAQECLKLNGVRVDDDPDELMENFPMFFYTSALKNDGVDDLLHFLLERATPTTVFDVEPGQSTHQEPEQRAEEIIREKLYRCLHKEVPYQIRQRNRLFEVMKGKKDGTHVVNIQQDLIVKTKSHRDLVAGRGNQTLDRIRETAARDLAKEFGCPVDLLLHIKLVKSKNWSVG